MLEVKKALEEALRDDAGWHEFVCAYEPALMGFFLKRVHDHCAAGDLVQEVFYRLLRRKSGTQITDMRGYVFEVARNVLKDKARRDAARRTGRHVRFDPDHHGGSDFCPERVFIGKQSLVRIIEAVESLPQRTQDVFVLRAFENMKYREIAATMGLSIRAVEKHMAKALAHVGKALDEQE